MSTRVLPAALALFLVATALPAAADESDSHVESTLGRASVLIEAGNAEQAIELLLAQPLPEHPRLQLEVLRLRGNALVDLGRARDAAATYVRAADGAALHGWHEAEESFLFAAFSNLVDEFDFLGLETILARLLEVQRGLGDPIAAAKTESDLGAVRVELGRTRRGIQHYLAARDVFRTHGSRKELVHIEVSLATAHRLLGELAEALTYAERAREMASELEDQLLLGDAYEALGSVYADLGRHERAIEYYEKTVGIFRAQQNPDFAYTLGNIGSMLVELGQYDTGEALIREACPVLDGLGDQRSAALCDLHLGRAALRRGKLDEALAHLDAAQRLAKDDPFVTGHITRYRGDALLERGDAKAALEVYEHSLALARATEEAALQADALRGKAEAHLGIGDASSAVAAIREAIGILHRSTAGLGDELGAEARAIEDRARVVETALRAAFQHGAPAVVAEFLECSRAGAFLEAVGGREALRGEGLPAALVREEEDAKARVAAATFRFRAVRAEGTLSRSRAARGALREARRAYQDVSERAQRVAKQLGSSPCPEPAALETLQDGLDENRALVLYAVLPERAYALVVTAEDARVADLGPTDLIESACRDLRPNEREARASDEALLCLECLLLDPLELADGAQLVVSPDAFLTRLPWPVLAQGHDVSCVPSGTTYDLLRPQQERAGIRLLALGDPAYSATEIPRGARGVDEGAPLPRLPQTRVEARSIARDGDTVLLGLHATEMALRRALATEDRWCSIHLACHGLLNENTPAYSALALTPADDDDGLLTALEVLRMRVPADLVVLSACERV